MSSNSSMLPWFMHVAGFDMSDDLMYVWHQLTRLGNSREGLLIDPGAFDNLSGDRWGVGDGRKQSGIQAIVPGVMKTSDGRL
eukprot:122758-Karenia_brevis.AAC.1